MDNWQFWLLVVWLLFIGYCLGRVHAHWIVFNDAVKKLKDLGDRINAE